MSRSYDTPAAFRQAVEQRLRDLAGGVGTTFERVRQRMVFDRFMARVSEVTDGEAVVKGGLALELQIANARSTVDIDLRLRGDPERLLGLLRDAARRDAGDYLTFVIEPHPDHPDMDGDGLVYVGLRFRAECRLAGKLFGRPFGVDVAYGDPMLAAARAVTGADYLGFAGIPPVRHLVYPVETHVAEKLHAYTLPRRRENTRVKDLPDIALLAGAGVMEAGLVRAAIEQTFAHRGTHGVPLAVPMPPEGWGLKYAAMAEDYGLPWGTLGEVAVAAKEFLNPVLSGSARGTWDAAGWRWGGVV